MARPTSPSVLLPVIVSAILAAVAWGYTDRVQLESRISVVETGQAAIEKRLDRIEAKIDILLQSIK